MKIKRLLVLAVLPMLCLAVNAQNSSKDNTPKKGDFTVAATVGYNSYTSVTAPYNATIILTPITPLVFSLALRSSSLNPKILFFK